MRITKTIIWSWLLLFLPFFAFKLYNKYKANEKAEQLNTATLRLYIGTKFPLQSFVDETGKDAPIDVGKSELTVVDFWFRDCPPCLNDMRHYSRLIKGRDKQIKVFTVCINRFDIWKALLRSSDKRFSMLSEKAGNWNHLVLKSSEDPKLNNPVPPENIRLIESTFQSISFPMYFVLDKNGVIKATPFSLSKYIELDVLRHDPFWYFLSQEITWTADYFFIPSAFVEYSGYFWIATIFFLSISHYLISRKTNQRTSSRVAK